MKNLYRPAILSIQPYQPGKPLTDVQREYGLTEVIKLASNENPLGPSPRAREAAAGVLDHMHLYPEGSSRAVKQAVVEQLGVLPEQLIIGNGSDELLKLIGETFLLPTDEVLMAEPTFSEYRFAARLMGSQERTVPLQSFRHDLSAMRAAVTKQTKLIFICNPNNPTGTIVSHSELAAFLSSLPDHIITVIDEAYAEYVVDPNYPDSLALLAEKHPIIILRTLSKIYGLASLRIGYGLAAPETTALIERVREPFNVNAVAQAAAAAALYDHEHVRQSRAVNEAGKQYLYREFSRLGLDYIPTEANFILVHLQRDSQQVFEALLKRGVIIRPTGSFGLPEHMRVTIGTPEQNQRLVSALGEVLA